MARDREKSSSLARRWRQTRRRRKAWDGSVEKIERTILLRELEAQMTPEEAGIFQPKALGFSSEEIAKQRGSSVNSVDKAMSHLKQKIHALIGLKE